MIAGLEPQTDERSLTLAVTPIAPVKDLRLVKHKHSLESRGFAFCDLFSVDDAKKVLNALNGAHIDVQSTPLRLMFTRDGKQAGRHYEDPNNPDDAAVADADAAPADDWKYSYEESNSARSSDHAADASKQPEQPKHALDAWEPAAFSETDLQESIEMHLTAAADAAQEDTREPSDARDVQKRLERHQQLLHNQEEQTLSEEDAQEGHKQAPSSTYIWDENSQTYYEQTSGYYVRQRFEGLPSTCCTHHCLCDGTVCLRSMSRGGNYGMSPGMAYGTTWTRHRNSWCHLAHVRSNSSNMEHHMLLNLAQVHRTR